MKKLQKNIAKVLDDEEKIWVKSQNILHEQKLKKNPEKGTHQFGYVNNLLTNCKKHGGPFVSTEEVEYSRHSCICDAQQRPHLYKVNQLSLTEMKVNITTLLTNNL